jgi:hypothetical protein
MNAASTVSLEGSVGSCRERRSWIVRASHNLVNMLRGGEEVEVRDPSTLRARTSVVTTFGTRRRSGSDLLEPVIVTAPVAPDGPAGLFSTPSTGHIFNERWLSGVQSRARSEGRRTGSLMGCLIGSIGLIPLGPVLMILSGVAGLLLGLSIGAVVDIQRARATRTAAERELRRLTYLVRFAIDQINRKTYSSSGQSFACEIIEQLVLEFKPYIQLAHLSPVLRKKLLLLYSFIQDSHVNQCLWLYLEEFLEKLNSDLSVVEFVGVCRDVFGPLLDLEKKLGYHEVPRESRLEILVKLEDFLNDSRVKQFYRASNGATPPTENDNALRSLEALVGMAKHTRTFSETDSMYMTPDGVASPVSDDEQDNLIALNFMDAISMEGSVVGDDNISVEEMIHRRKSAEVLRKPFFQSYRDFMDFDVTLKHQMPVTGSEFRFLFEKEAESMTSPGWELAVDKKLIKILKQDTPQAILLRAYATLPNQTAELVFYQISDPKKRQAWDTNFSEISLVDPETTPECEILYCQLSAPFGITPRDFLQYRKALRDNSGAISILMRSAQHSGKPELNGFIRAESYISGYVIRQEGPDVKLFIMSQTDIKGLIPKWMVNMVAAKAPAQWVDNLSKACAKVLVKDFDSDKEKMNTFLTNYVNNCTENSIV